MGKSKKKDEPARKPHKKSKHAKSPKSSKDTSNEDHVDGKFKRATLIRKQTELARVYQLKCSMLLQGNLSYLEYVELRDEICRLNVMKEVFHRRAIALEKH